MKGETGQAIVDFEKREDEKSESYDEKENEKALRGKVTP